MSASVLVSLMVVIIAFVLFSFSVSVASTCF